MKKSGIQVSNLGTAFTGAKEAVEFDDYLKSLGIKNQGIIIAGQVYEFFGATIQILTPTEAHLKDILSLFKGLIKDDVSDPYTAGKGDWTIDFDTLIAVEKRPSSRHAVNEKSAFTRGSMSIPLHKKKPANC